MALTLQKLSPVVKPVTVRVILTIAISKGWHITQLDVNNAFLYGILDEEVYMQQPLGLESADSTMVCKLNKTLYGIKQAPRAWFERLTMALKGFGFVSSKCDPSLFTLVTPTYTTYMLVYVDDIIITVNSSTQIQQLITKLHSQFALKQLGKYIKDLLSKANMSDAKGVPTPMISSLKLSKHGTNLMSEPSFYRSIVGPLQYATITRPEICYVVNKACQFLSQPLDSHWVAVKRILRYLKGSLHHDLLLQPATTQVPISIQGLLMQTGVLTLMTGNPHLAHVFFWVQILFLGGPKSKLL